MRVLLRHMQSRGRIDQAALDFGLPVAYFVRSDRATGTYTYQDPVGEVLCSMFGDEALDVFVNGAKSSDEARQEAEDLATSLNEPETIERIATFLERRRHLEEAIRLVESDQQSRADEIGARIGLGEARPIKRYVSEEEAIRSWR